MRGCGILLHISSLPGNGGNGTLGADAHAFVDFLAAAGQSFWQILPLNPPAIGNSPYSSYSAFAGNPALINLELLEQQGLLALWTRKFLPPHRGESTNYAFSQKVQIPLLRQTFRNGYTARNDEIAAFRKTHAFWLEDYALFMAIRQQQGSRSFLEWPDALRLRDPAAVQHAAESLRDEVNFWVWVQYLFFQQWDALHHYAQTKGIAIIGDMPLYPAMDSADLWANPAIFQLDAHGRPSMVAGVPPDAFTEDGQRWGNPLYHWESLKEQGYHWWIERLRLAFRLYDQVRIDHFRGLDAYYAIPANAETARDGHWEAGPGMDFMRCIQQNFPGHPFIAEDLGFLTDSVRRLLHESGWPGMKVLQFAFDPNGDSDYLPHNFIKHCVGYTGTHDNDTSIGWAQSAPPPEIAFAEQYLNCNKREGFHWGLIRGLYATAADTVIVPMQDILGLDSSARMNTPGICEEQWTWRLDRRQLTERIAERIRELAVIYRRTQRWG